MRSMTWIGWILTCFTSLSFVGCTRASVESSTIRIQVPAFMTSNSVSSQALATGDQLGHVSINITGSDIAQPIIYSWDSCHDCSTTPAAPASFDIEVPIGQSRMIQVLAVYQNSTTQAMTFYYGDSTRSLSQAVEPVTIAISSISQGIQIASGRVMGRYFDSATGGPTGTVNMLFAPPAGKPKMIINRDFILNGWFTFFMLTDVPFEYQMHATGATLFGGPVSLDSPQFDPNSNALVYPHVVRALVPVRNEKKMNNGTTSFMAADPAYFVWGFFGDSTGVGSLPVCKVNMAGPFANIFQYPSTTTLLTPINSVSPADIPPTKATLFNSTTPYASAYFYGGATAGTGSCNGTATTAANLNSAWLSADSKFIDGNGNDSAAGFRVPFQLQPAAGNSMLGQAVAVDNSVDPRKLTAKVLPGIEQKVDSFQLYKRVSATKIRLEDPSCPAIAAGAYGFVAAGSAALAADGTVTITSNISAADGNTGVSAVICPAKSGGLLARGLFLDSWNFPGGISAGPPHHLSVYFQDSLPNYHNTSCVPMIVKVKDAANNDANVSTSITVSFNFTGATNTFSDPSCTSILHANGSSAPVSSNTLQMYVKMSNVIASSYSLSVASTGLASGIFNFGIVNSSTPASISKVAVVDPITAQTVTLSSYFSAYKCQTLLLQFQDAAGMPLLAGGGTNTMNLTGVVSSELDIYPITDKLCTGAPTSSLGNLMGTPDTNVPFNLSIKAGSAFSGFAASSTGAVVKAATTYRPTMSNLVNPTAINVAPINQGGPLSSTDLYISGGACIPLEVFPSGPNFSDRGTFGSIMAAGDLGFALNYSSDTMIMTSDPTCTSPTPNFNISSTVVAAADYRRVVYVKGTVGTIASFFVKNHLDLIIYSNLKLHFQ